MSATSSPLHTLREAIAHADAVAAHGAGAAAARASDLPLLLHEEAVAASPAAFADDAHAEAFFTNAVTALQHQRAPAAIDAEISALEQSLSRSGTMNAEEIKGHRLAQQMASLEAQLEAQLQSQPIRPAPAPRGRGGDGDTSWRQASVPSMWKREKSAFQQQVGELQTQLAASVRSNRVLVQHLAEIGPMAGGLPATASSCALDASASASVAHPSAPPQALRRRRAAELASADERRKVEVRAAKEVAARSMRAEQRHVAALQRHLHALEAEHKVAIASLRAALGESEAERRAADEGARLRLEQASREAEAQLGLQEELCRMREQAADRAAEQAQHAADWARERGKRKEDELRDSLGAAAAQLAEHQKQAHAAQTAMQLLHAELEVVQAALPQPRPFPPIDHLDAQIETQLGEARLRLSVLLGTDQPTAAPPAAAAASSSAYKTPYPAGFPTPGTTQRLSMDDDDGGVHRGGGGGGGSGGGGGGGGGLRHLELAAPHRESGASTGAGAPRGGGGVTKSPARREGEELARRIAAGHARCVLRAVANGEGAALVGAWGRWVGAVRLLGTQGELRAAAAAAQRRESQLQQALQGRHEGALEQVRKRQQLEDGLRELREHVARAEAQAGRAAQRVEQAVEAERQEGAARLEALEQKLGRRAAQAVDAAEESARRRAAQREEEGEAARQRERRAADDEVAALRRTIDALQTEEGTRLARVEAKAEDERARAAASSAAVAAASAGVAELEAAKHEMGARLAEAEARRDEAERRRAAAEEEAAAARASAASAEAASAEASGARRAAALVEAAEAARQQGHEEAAAAAAALAATRSQLAEAQAQAAEAARAHELQTAGLRAAAQADERKGSDAEGRAAEAEARAERAEARLRQCEAAVEAWRGEATAELQQAAAARGAAEETLALSEQMRGQLQSEVETLGAEAAPLRAKRDEAEREASKARAEAQRLEQEVAQHRAAAAAQVRKIEADADDLEFDDDDDDDEYDGTRGRGRGRRRSSTEVVHRHRGASWAQDAAATGEQEPWEADYTDDDEPAAPLAVPVAPRQAWWEEPGDEEEGDDDGAAASSRPPPSPGSVSMREVQGAATRAEAEFAKLRAVLTDGEVDHCKQLQKGAERAATLRREVRALVMEIQAQRAAAAAVAGVPLSNRSPSPSPSSSLPSPVFGMRGPTDWTSESLEEAGARVLSRRSSEDSSVDGAARSVSEKDALLSQAVVRHVVNSAQASHETLAAELGLLEAEAEQRLALVQMATEAARMDGERIAGVAALAVASELRDVEGRGASAAAEAEERGAALDEARAEGAALTEDNARLRAELATLMAMRQAQVQGSVAQTKAGNTRKEHDIKAALAEAEESLAAQQTAYGGRIEELEQMVQAAGAEATRRAAEATAVTVAAAEAQVAAEAEIAAVQEEAQEAREAAEGAKAQAEAAAEEAAEEWRALEARLTEAEEREAAALEEKEEAQAAVRAARDEADALRLEVDASRAQMAATQAAGVGVGAGGGGGGGGGVAGTLGDEAVAAALQAEAAEGVRRRRLSRVDGADGPSGGGERRESAASCSSTSASELYGDAPSIRRASISGDDLDDVGSGGSRRVSITSALDGARAAGDDAVGVARRASRAGVAEFGASAGELFVQAAAEVSQQFQTTSAVLVLEIAELEAELERDRSEFHEAAEALGEAEEEAEQSMLGEKAAEERALRAEAEVEEARAEVARLRAEVKGKLEAQAELAEEREQLEAEREAMAAQAKALQEETLRLRGSASGSFGTPRAEETPRRGARLSFFGGATTPAAAPATAPAAAPAVAPAAAPAAAAATPGGGSDEVRLMRRQLALMEEGIAQQKAALQGVIDGLEAELRESEGVATTATHALAAEVEALELRSVAVEDADELREQGQRAAEAQTDALAKLSRAEAELLEARVAMRRLEEEVETKTLDGLPSPDGVAAAVEAGAAATGKKPGGLRLTPGARKKESAKKEAIRNLSAELQSSKEHEKAKEDQLDASLAQLKASSRACERLEEQLQAKRDELAQARDDVHDARSMQAQYKEKLDAKDKEIAQLAEQLQSCIFEKMQEAGVGGKSGRKRSSG